MVMAPAHVYESAVEGLGGIALWLGAFWGRPGPPIDVSIFSVWRAARRKNDPLPIRKPLHRVVAIESELKSWALRQIDEHKKERDSDG